MNYLSLQAAKLELLSKQGGRLCFSQQMPKHSTIYY